MPLTYLVMCRCLLLIVIFACTFIDSSVTFNGLVSFTDQIGVPPMGIVLHPIHLIQGVACCNFSRAERLLGAEWIWRSSVFLEGLGVDESLSYEEVLVEILDRQVKKLRNKEAASVKVFWRNNLVEGATWEDKADMMSRYPHIFRSSPTLA
ncbi:hypothetical protein MTR67_007043 [Solanum verrucosum]|uniref:Uncharacterized protein n=1 Tax=Solanum verrucosum TaxID=315347 RepID=A0AAF0TEN4_SOLVR|nr:hypothetical protein MTR67_007043 [Solanum verrucosum]